MNHHKRIVLDFDDTLAFAVNRDWENATPNNDLIQKTNQLYDEGWTIDIFTARGSLSCKTRSEAAEKYQPGMERWLAKHNVKYHSISFNKPLAAYYVDDKGISPKNFLDVAIQQLHGGLSGSDIYTDGETVHKQDENAHAVRDWYESVKGVNVPRVDRIVGETITMKYIEHDEDFFYNNFYVALGMIQDTIVGLENNPIPDDGLVFDDYCSRIMDHAVASGESDLIRIAESIRSYDLKRSFSHGDFGITNMLFTKDQKMFLIDPIPHVFGCKEMDCAKFIASLHINRYPTNMKRRAEKIISIYNDLDTEMFKYLIAAEVTRVYKYHPNKNFIMECVRNVFE